MNITVRSTTSSKKLFIFTLLTLLGLVSLIKWLIQTTSREKSETNGGRVLDILKERYARGEIDKKKFKEMKKDLL